MNIRVKNKIVTVAFETSDKIEMNNYDGIVQEIVRDAKNGSNKFIFDFHMVKDQYDSSVIGLVVGIIMYLSHKNNIIILRNIHDYGKEMLMQCSVHKLIEEKKVILE